MTKKQEVESQQDQGPSTALRQQLNEAPVWLLSMVLHLVLVIVLGLLSFGGREQVSILVNLDATDEYDALDELQADLELPSLDDLSAPNEKEAASQVLDTPNIEPLELDLNELATISSEVLQAEKKSIMSLASLSKTDGSLLGRGRKGLTNFYGVSGEGNSFVYVFDRSDSMNSVFTRYSEGIVVKSTTPLKSAKIELIKSIKSLKNHNEFQLVFYNSMPMFFRQKFARPKMCIATNENKQDAISFVDYTRGNGNTEHMPALYAAVKLKPDIIFHLTDAEAQDDPSMREVKRLVRSCKGRIKINVIHFCNTPRPNCTLISLAEKTDGKHVFIDLKTIAQ